MNILRRLCALGAEQHTPSVRHPSEQGTRREVIDLSTPEKDTVPDEHTHTTGPLQYPSAEDNEQYSIALANQPRIVDELQNWLGYRVPSPFTIPFPKHKRWYPTKFDRRPHTWKDFVQSLKQGSDQGAIQLAGSIGAVARLDTWTRKEIRSMDAPDFSSLRILAFVPSIDKREFYRTHRPDRITFIHRDMIRVIEYQKDVHDTALDFVGLFRTMDVIVPPSKTVERDWNITIVIRARDGTAVETRAKLSVSLMCDNAFTFPYSSAVLRSTDTNEVEGYIIWRDCIYRESASVTRFEVDRYSHLVWNCAIRHPLQKHTMRLIPLAIFSYQEYKENTMIASANVAGGPDRPINIQMQSSGITMLQLSSRYCAEEEHLWFDLPRCTTVCISFTLGDDVKIQSGDIELSAQTKQFFHTKLTHGTRCIGALLLAVVTNRDIVKNIIRFHTFKSASPTNTITIHTGDYPFTFNKRKQMVWLQTKSKKLLYSIHNVSEKGANFKPFNLKVLTCNKNTLGQVASGELVLHDNSTIQFSSLRTQNSSKSKQTEVCCDLFEKFKCKHACSMNEAVLTWDIRDNRNFYEYVCASFFNTTDLGRDQLPIPARSYPQFAINDIDFAFDRKQSARDVWKERSVPVKTTSGQKFTEVIEID